MTTDMLRQIVEVEQDAELWGTVYRITPRLVTGVLGDGKQLIWVSPICTRPNYYVARIDSAHQLSNWSDDTDHTPDTWLDDLYELIEDDFGNGNDSEEYLPFPTLRADNGCSWGAYELPSAAVAQ